ncbi:MAG: SDR family NAD(P)-dependent oxidoreductase, partial [Actinobacteria bacterium]|nr:SDR family NAD(P)-dependent oxidoreductase [Actinomycetota bacterium]
MKFEGKTILITGSSRGIGKAIAVKFAKEGANLVINGRNQSKIDETVNEIKSMGASAFGFKADVRDMQSVEYMIEKINQVYGEINILVNNAAILEVKSIFDISEEKWVEIIDTNLNGVFRVTKAALRIMINHRKYNKIINMSSQAAKTGGLLPVHR